MPATAPDTASGTAAKVVRIVLAPGEFEKLIRCGQGSSPDGSRYVVDAGFGPSGAWIVVPVGDPYRWDVLVIAKLRGVPLPPSAQAAYDALPQSVRDEAEKA